MSPVGLGLGIRVRVTRALRTFARRRRQAPALSLRRDEVGRLHIGAGRAAIPGWVNVDLEPLPGIELVLDVRRGLPFERVQFIYAEHFLEHLTHDEGVRFLAEARRALAADGVLRLSTPNLDWVVSTQYRRPSPDPVSDCFSLNKAFRGWGHQFLYNYETLKAALTDAGFAVVRACAYGESEHDVLRGLEQHETYPDAPDLPHVIIVEASGMAPRQQALAARSEEYDWAVNP